MLSTAVSHSTAKRSDCERIDALEARSSLLSRVVLLHQVLLVVMAAAVAWCIRGVAAPDATAKPGTLLTTVDRDSILSRHEQRLDGLDVRLGLVGDRAQVLEQRAASHAWDAQHTREALRQLSVVGVENKAPHSIPSAHVAAPRTYDRQLAQQAPTDDRAILRVDAPEGVSQIILGAKQGEDNVIMEKGHVDYGGDFTLSRNSTRVLGVDLDGGLTVHSDPLKIASTLRTTAGAPLFLQGDGGIQLQSVSTHEIEEVDGQGVWSESELTIYKGDTVTWTWTNYHNVIETDIVGSIKAGGVQSGLPELSGKFSYTFDTDGVFYFKSQTQFSMTCSVTVLAAVEYKGGTLKVGGDLEVGGNLRVGSFYGLQGEIKMFLATECPSGWTEATELGGYMLMGRPHGGSVNVTQNRPMSADEEGRMHSTYYKGDASKSSNYDDRYMGGYYDSTGSSSSCGARTCSSCHLPSSQERVSCTENFGKYQWLDWYYNGNSRSYYRWDKLTNPAYQTSQYMGPIGEFYPFVSVLICKRE